MRVCTGLGVMIRTRVRHHQDGEGRDGPRHQDPREHVEQHQDDLRRPRRQDPRAHAEQRPDDEGRDGPRYQDPRAHIE
eukprot:2185870-Alexandrium_andersonii.AAC.1